MNAIIAEQNVSGALQSLADLKEVAKSIAPAFRLQPDQALVLLLFAQAEGIHPVKGLQLYHIIEGRPAMKADAMLAKFQQNGGAVEWETTNAERCDAVFSHPKHMPKGVRVEITAQEMWDRKIALAWDKDAQQWKVKHNWAQHTAAMLRARAISAGVRMVYPGIIAGIHSVEEMEDAVASETTPAAGGQTRHERAKAMTEAADAAAKANAEAKEQPAQKEKQAQQEQPAAEKKDAPTAEKKDAPAFDELEARAGMRKAADALCALIGPVELTRLMVRLNERHNCGTAEVKGVRMRVMSACPSENVAAYLADLQEELRIVSESKKQAGGAP